MSTIVVNGSSIQTAINGAQVDDDIDVRGSGTYAAFEVNKRVKVHGNGTAKVAGTSYPIKVKTAAGGSLVEGFASIGGSTGKNLACVLLEQAHNVTVRDSVIENGLQYGIRSYLADGAKIIDNEIRQVAVGIVATKNFANAVVTGNNIHDINKMLVDDGSLGTNGGDGIQLIDTAAGALIENNDITSTRARSVGGVSWDYDGGAITGYGKCAAITFKGNRIRDCVNVIETGTDASKGGVPTGWVVEGNEVWGNPDVAPNESRSCVGFFLRANVNWIIRGNKFHELDDFFLRLVQTGSYAGPMTGNLITDNDFWIKPGASSTYTWNRAYVVHNSVVPATFGKIEGNRIYFDAAKSPQVAEFTGKGATKDLAVWKGWTGWGTGETWGPVVVPPVDPCLAVKAERDAALAQVATLTSQLATANSALAAANGKIAAAKAALG